MTTITYIILKVKSMIKKQIVENHTFFAVCYSQQDQFTYTAFMISNLQKDFHQGNL